MLPRHTKRTDTGFCVGVDDVDDVSNAAEAMGLGCEKI